MYLFLSHLFLINTDKGLYSLLMQMVTYFYLYNWSRVLALIRILLCWIKGKAQRDMSPSH